MQKFYFASLLMVFGIEITCDWLFFSYSKVRLQDMLLLHLASLWDACMRISMLHAHAAHGRLVHLKAVYLKAV